MLLCQKIISALYENYLNNIPHAKKIHHALQAVITSPLVIDHFALIDLPSAHSGIATLKRLFNLLNYEERGSDYLIDKQNDFMWLAHRDSPHQTAQCALPQVVIADFRISEMPSAVSKIINQYAMLTKPFPFSTLETYLIRWHKQQAASTANAIVDLVTHYLAGRDWPLPTVAQFNLVRDFNELLAWVLIFGRKPNHFTFSLHLQTHFASLADFNDYVEQDLALPLNHEGGTIKGTLAGGLMQSSTKAANVEIALADGTITITDAFMEFVWRHALTPIPLQWSDYYLDFIGSQANQVIESLYLG